MCYKAIKINIVIPVDILDQCSELDGVEHLDICKQMDVMLICAYLELILPIFTIAGSFMFTKEGPHVWGSNLPALGSIAAGSIFLSLYYGGKCEH